MWTSEWETAHPYSCELVVPYSCNSKKFEFFHHKLFIYNLFFYDGPLGKWPLYLEILYPRLWWGEVVPGRYLGCHLYYFLQTFLAWREWRLNHILFLFTNIAGCSSGVIWFEPWFCHLEIHWFYLFFTGNLTLWLWIQIPKIISHWRRRSTFKKINQLYLRDNIFPFFFSFL